MDLEFNRAEKSGSAFEGCSAQPECESDFGPRSYIKSQNVQAEFLTGLVMVFVLSFTRARTFNAGRRISLLLREVTSRTHSLI